MTDPSNKKRVLSGMRSTGKLHLGNYVGALENWVRMQEQYECFFFIADWHALTTDYADTSHIKDNSVEVLLDWLAAGLDPEKCVMFIQSHVPAHAELHLLLSMITPLGWLERVPTYKEQRENIKEKDLGTYGFLGYPVLQSADILIYKADFVPVGEDQVAHVELTREIARRFNGFYAGKREYVFPEPQSLLTPAAKLPGTDGRKMSKSYGNTILLTDPEPVVRQKLKTMVTDPARGFRRCCFGYGRGDWFSGMVRRELMQVRHFAELRDGSYLSDMPIESRTSFMVAPATRAARAEPASRISHARRGLSSYFFRRSCMGLRIFTSASAAQPLHSMQPMPADRHPSFTFAIVGWSLNILCRSPTGQRSGLPGSVRRTRAGSVTMVFSFCRSTGSGSVSKIVFPYDFDILRPSVPGNFAAGVRRD